MATGKCGCTSIAALAIFRFPSTIRAACTKHTELRTHTCDNTANAVSSRHYNQRGGGSERTSFHFSTVGAIAVAAATPAGSVAAPPVPPAPREMVRNLSRLT